MSTKKEKKIGPVALKREFSNALGRFVNTPSLDLILEMNDPIYCQRRVIELIRQNEVFGERMPLQRREENIQLAACLLAAILVKGMS